MKGHIDKETVELAKVQAREAEAKRREKRLKEIRSPSPEKFIETDDLERRMEKFRFLSPEQRKEQMQNLRVRKIAELKLDRQLDVFQENHRLIKKVEHLESQIHEMEAQQEDQTRRFCQKSKEAAQTMLQMKSLEQKVQELESQNSYLYVSNQELSRINKDIYESYLVVSAGLSCYEQGKIPIDKHRDDKSEDDESADTESGSMFGLFNF